MALSKQSTCSSSESRNALRRESTVDMTEAGLLCAVECSTRKPSGLVVRRQLAHQKLEVTLALYLAGFQQILHQLEDRDDVPALLWMLLIRRQKLRQHQNDRSEQPLRRIIEKSILSAVAVIAIGVDNGFIILLSQMLSK